MPLYADVPAPLVVMTIICNLLSESEDLAFHMAEEMLEYIVVDNTCPYSTVSLSCHNVPFSRDTFLFSSIHFINRRVNASTLAYSN